MRVSLVFFLFVSLLIAACQDQSPTPSKPSASPAKTPAVSPPATPAPTPSPSQPQATPAASGQAPAARQPIAWSRDLVEKKLASIQSMRFKTTITIVSQVTMESKGSSDTSIWEGCFARPYKFRATITAVSSPPTPQTGVTICDGQSLLEGSVLGNGPVTQATTCNVSALVSSGADMDRFLPRKLPFFPLMVFRSFGDSAEVRFLGEMWHGGKHCGQFSVKGQAPGDKIYVYIDPDTMLPVAFASLKPDGGQGTHVISNVTYVISNVNEPLPPAEFSFPPVQGNAQDLTSAYTRMLQRR